MSRYRSLTGREVRISTTVILVLLGVISTVLLGQAVMSFLHGALYAGLIGLISACIGPVIALFARRFVPRGYDVENGAIIIRRAAGDIVIAKQTLRSVRQLQREELKHSVRLFGGAGLFGSFGWFANHTLGKHRRYTTSSDELVLLQTASGTFVISPERAAAFVSEVGRG